MTAELHRTPPHITPEEAVFTVHVTLVRCSGSYVTGNPGASYGVLMGSYYLWRPEEWLGFEKAEVEFGWNATTTSAGIRLWNISDGEAVAVSEPGTTGWRTDIIDVTDVLKGYASSKGLRVETKGDGSTAPEVERVLLRIRYRVKGR